MHFFGHSLISADTLIFLPFFFFFFLLVLVAQLCLTLCDPSLGKNTGVDSHFLLQRIFPTQGFEPGSPALQADSLLY